MVSYATGVGLAVRRDRAHHPVVQYAELQLFPVAGIVGGVALGPGHDEQTYLQHGVDVLSVCKNSRETRETAVTHKVRNPAPKATGPKSRSVSLERNRVFAKRINEFLGYAASPPTQVVYSQF